MKTLTAPLALAVLCFARVLHAQELPEEAPPPVEAPGEFQGEEPWDDSTQEVWGNGQEYGPGPQAPFEAPPPAPFVEDRKAHRHLGFYLRGDVGLGYLDAAEGTGGIIDRTSGVAVGLGLALGGALSENNLLAVHFFEVAHGAAHASPNGVQDLGYGLGGVGAQFTHYFMPLNLYLSGTLGLTQGVATRDGWGGGSSSIGDHSWWDHHGWTDSSFNSGAARHTRGGVGAVVSVGKEWWVADHLGLGVSLTALASFNRDPTPTGHTTLNTGALYVGFSATFN